MAQSGGVPVIVIILLSVLFIILIAAVLFFLFGILFPSLKDQKINARDPLFSKEEVELVTGNPDFRHFEIGKRAVVLCSPKRNFQNKRFTYEGKKDCMLFKSVYSTEYDCNYGCTGFGNCVRACPRQAITIENNTAVVNSACNGCGLCISVCPKDLIVLMPKEQTECVLCKAPETEKNGCSMCAKKGNIERLGKRGFQFWEKCYKIMNRK